MRKEDLMELSEFIALVTLTTVVVMGSILLWTQSFKIAGTMWKLIALHDNILFCQATGDDEGDGEWQERRAMEFYNSPDDLVSTYSRCNALVKVIWGLGAILAIPAIPIMYLEGGIIILRYKKGEKKPRRPKKHR